MSIKDNRTFLNNFLASELGNVFGKRQNAGGGLLNFVKSPYAADIGMGLLAQSGYSTMPTSFGQSLGIATNQANELRRQRNADQISKLATAAQLSNSMKPDVFQRDTTKDLYVDNQLKEKGIPTPILPKSADFFNMINPDTKEKRLINLRNPDDRAFLNSPDSIGFVKSSVETTTQQLDKIDKTKERTFIETYEATNNIVNSLTDFKDQINKGTVTTGAFAGGINRTISNIKTELGDLKYTFVKDNSSDIAESSDIIENAEGYLTENFGKQLDESAIDTGILKSMVIQIAYDYAKINNKDGRISEQDFKKGVEILLAGGVKSKDAILKNSDRLMKDAVDRLKTSYTGFSISEELEKDNKYKTLYDSVLENYNTTLTGGVNNNNNQNTSSVGGSIVIDLDKYQWLKQI